MKHIGLAIKNFSDFLKKSNDLMLQISSCWGSISGRFCKCTRVEKILRETLFIEVSDPRHLYELRLLKDDFLDALYKNIPSNSISNIRFTYVPFEEVKFVPARRDFSNRLFRDGSVDNDFLDEKLSIIKDEKMKTLLKEFYKKYV